MNFDEDKLQCFKTIVQISASNTEIIDKLSHLKVVNKMLVGFETGSVLCFVKNLLLLFEVILSKPQLLRLNSRLVRHLKESCYTFTVLRQFL